ncbi:MAG TPA: agmatinase [Terriglobales bacterium]|nr:agmatinase [Terriglobales bacterium]
MSSTARGKLPWGAPTLLGVPFDANSSYKRGSAAAPPLIRDALRCDSSNLWTELGVEVGAEGAYADAGDLRLTEGDPFPAIEQAVDALLEKRKRPVCLGGDHSITYPILRAFGRKFKDLTLIHFDAHPDLYDEFQGSRHSHASPFARIMEEKITKRLIQVGIRTMNPEQEKQAKRFGVEVYKIGHQRALEEVKTWCPVYVSFDMDVLDPAFAPGVSHREPGGMSVREVLEHLHSITATIVGADIVEYNPSRDVSELTATVAGKLLKEVLGKMMTSCTCP